jgi:drug/metabolite transporter (DMT)-like permease
VRARASAEAALLITAVIWSLNFTAVKVGVLGIAPLAFCVLRFGLGASVTAAVVLVREGVPRFRREDLGLLTAAAICGTTINQIAFVGAESISSASNVALLVGTIPIWTAVMAVATRQERLDAAHWISLAAGITGVALIVLGGSRAGEGAVSLLGAALALLTAATWGGYTVLIYPLVSRYSALQLSAFVMVFGSIALVPFGLRDLLAENWRAVPSDAWLALAFAAIFGVALTNILYFTAIQYVGAVRAAIYAYLEPLLGVLFAVLLLADQVALPQLAGGAIIIGAVALARPGRGGAR